jgi:hypothetical protein
MKIVQRGPPWGSTSNPGNWHWSVNYQLEKEFIQFSPFFTLIHLHVGSVCAHTQFYAIWSLLHICVTSAIIKMQSCSISMHSYCSVFAPLQVHLSKSKNSWGSSGEACLVKCDARSSNFGTAKNKNKNRRKKEKYYMLPPSYTEAES